MEPGLWMCVRIQNTYMQAGAYSVSVPGETGGILRQSRIINIFHTCKKISSSPVTISLPPIMTRGEFMAAAAAVGARGYVSTKRRARLVHS